ncbi:MAG: serine/threonine-protein kinase [Acidobacteriota bacterium]|nr:serine/threonine-protein kinase [Acidobacteriota bacterium]
MIGSTPAGRSGRKRERIETERLQSGAKLGPYAIAKAIGSGGMGDVYLATDTRLDRQVAIKVLPPEFSEDAERKARFKREAKTISQLHAPNICTLFDIGEQEGLDYLVMEYLEGKTLAEMKLPLPIAEVLKIGSQMAEGLAAAHKQGIVHRDLTPANVMITKGGIVKLLDFGLAKGIGAIALGTREAGDGRPLTGEGLIVGTLPYMAPEQIEGREADARTDLFALGTVLYEIATGKRAFEGTTKASLIAAIVSTEPLPMGELQPLAPPAFQHVVDKCLSKDPDRRWHSAHDIGEQLRWIAEAASHGGTAATVMRRTRERLAWGLAAGIAAVTALIVAGLLLRRPAAAPRTVRLSIGPPPGMTFAQHPVITELAVSPDGQNLALIATEGRRRRLFIRSLDSLAAREIEGSDGAGGPFWSPDSKWIGFFAAGSLKKVPLGGGPIQTLASAQGDIGSWNTNGQIVFSEWGPTANEDIRMISNSGGPSRAVTDASRGWSIWPSFLPDGRHFVFFGFFKTEPGLYVGSVDDPKDMHLLLRVRSRGEVRGEDLYYVRDSVLVRQRFNLKELRVEGDPIPIAEPVFCFAPLGAASFSVSADGAVLAWQRRALATQLVWRDWTGHELGRAGKPELFRGFALSPDEQRLAVDIFDPVTEVSNVSLFDLDRGVSTVVSTPGPGGSSTPYWMHNGNTLIISRGDPAHLTQAPALTVLTLSDGKTRSLRSEDGVQYATSITEKDDLVIYTIDRGLYRELYMIPTSGGGKNISLGSNGSHDESDAVLSPDQRWLALQSDESGRPEVYLRPFNRTGEKVRVSTDGGSEPKWSVDGRSLFFLSPAGMLLKADLDLADRPRVLRETPMFSISSAGMMEFDSLGISHYVVTRDRVLVREIPGGVDSNPVTVLVNLK